MNKIVLGVIANMINKTEIYLMDCDVLQDKNLFNEFYQKMPEYRKQKINTFRFAKDKRLSLGVGILLGCVLEEVGLKDIIVKKNGKPHIPGCPLCYNLSHSGSIAIIAVSKNNIGCDVEYIKPTSMKAAERFFCDDEYKLLENAVTDSKRTELFYRLWTLKESFMKATGLGMSLPLSDFAIAFKNNVPYVKQRVSNKSYSFKEYSWEDRYCIAVCTERKMKFDSHIKEIKI